MRIPLPKSKLVTLALVALLGSGAAAATLAAPSLWSDTMANATHSTQPEPTASAWDAEEAEIGDDGWEGHEDDDFDDRP